MRRPPTACQGVVPPVTEPSHAVFLSYASQDAEAAQRICEALRSAGVEVFLDQSELRGGDAWDHKIRHEIHDCALFIPIVSQHTQERLEGYFRHEWKLAIERTHHMAEQKPFLVPVVIDGTRDQEAFVPDAFRVVQWTRLPAGDTPPAFVERIKRLLSPELSPLSSVPGAAPGIRPVRASWRSKPVLIAIVAVVAFAALAYFVADKFWISKHQASPPTPPATPVVAQAAFAPPPHSIAVLPFVNMSGDNEQEYFSDGLTEELLNSLARINELQVSARTSSFSFKGEKVDLGTIARKLNVGAILEGSVRRSGNTIRITAQLNNAVTGFHLWSQTYDRDLKDVLKLQTEIANAVASALRVTLLGDVVAKIELGGTRIPAAFDAFLRAAQAGDSGHGEKDMQAAIDSYTEAIHLDPNYALAFGGRSLATSYYAANIAGGPKGFVRAQADARKAIALAPDLAEGHLALAVYLNWGAFDFVGANKEYERAAVLAPGSARVLRYYASFSAEMGHTKQSLAAVRRAVVLDPLNPRSYSQLGDVLFRARLYEEALAAYANALARDSGLPVVLAHRGVVYYVLGDFQAARTLCEIKPDIYQSQECLAVTYNKLGRRSAAEAVIKKMIASAGDDSAMQYVAIYAQWGDNLKALDWLETAKRLRDSGLADLRAYPLLDPLRQEPRFQAIERELKFPP
jgi:TolB-like protein